MDKQKNVSEIAKIEQIVDRIENIDITSVKVFIESELKKVEKISDEKTKEELLGYVEEQANNLPYGDLKPVAQLGVTSLKVIVELVEANQTGEGITTV